MALRDASIIFKKVFEKGLGGLERRWLRHTQKGVKNQCGAGSCDRFTARPSVSANLIAYGDRRIPAFATLTTPRLILAHVTFAAVAGR